MTESKKMASPVVLLVFFAVLVAGFSFLSDRIIQGVNTIKPIGGQLNHGRFVMPSVQQIYPVFAESIRTEAKQLDPRFMNEIFIPSPPPPPIVHRPESIQVAPVTAELEPPALKSDYRGDVERAIRISAFAKDAVFINGRLMRPGEPLGFVRYQNESRGDRVESPVLLSINHQERTIKLDVSGYPLVMGRN